MQAITKAMSHALTLGTYIGTLVLVVLYAVVATVGESARLIWHGCLRVKTRLYWVNQRLIRFRVTAARARQEG